MSEKKEHKPTGQIEVNELSEKTKKSMKGRILVALAMIAIVGPASVLGGYFWFAIVSIVFLFAAFELIKAPHHEFPKVVYPVVFILMVVIAYFPFLRRSFDEFVSTGVWEFDLELSMATLYVSPISLMVAFVLFFWFATADERITLPDVTYFVSMILLVGLGMQSALYVRYLPFRVVSDFFSIPSQSGYVDASQPVFKYWHSLELLYFILLGSLLNDTFAYFVGVFFGKHHMNERISPKKTWEGFFGGWILGGGSTIAFGLICSACGFPLLPGVLDLPHWYLIVLGGLLLPVLGDLGDLSFSIIKRHYNFKDFGFILGPHGGVLDRVDSSIFCLVGFSAFLSIVISIMEIAH